MEPADWPKRQETTQHSPTRAAESCTVENKSQLIEYFETACKVPEMFALGTEQEQFVYHSGNFRPAEYEGPDVGERLLKSVVALDQQLAKVAADKVWSKRLSIDQLEVTVSMTSDQPASDSDRKSLEEILKSYRAIAKDEDDAVVSQLTEFKETLKALQEYLRPRDRQPPKE